MKVIDQDLREHREFTGLRNNVDSISLGLGDLEVALNVNINDAGVIQTRAGYSTVLIAGVDRDLFADGDICLGVGSNTLKKIAADLSITTLRSGLTPGLPLSYAVVGDRAFYANGAERGVVQGNASRTWGIEVPVVGAITTTGGALPAGKYQVTLTFLREDGQESGAPRASVVELSETAGFTVALPSSLDDTVAYVNVYVSAVNAETLFLHARLLNGATSYAVLEQRPGTVELVTQFLSPPPAGTSLTYANGRLLVASGNRLYPSEAYAPELFDIRKSVPFTSGITEIAALKGGVLIGTESQIIWLANADPENWEFQVKAPYRLIPGTIAIDTIAATEKGNAPVAFFATSQGLCLITEDGTLENFTEGRFAYPIQERGAGLVRRHRGMIQYIATLHGVEVAGNVAA